MNCILNKKNIILFGANKGGTGALLQGIIGKYHTVVVDPIVLDEFFVKNRND